MINKKMVSGLMACTFAFGVFAFGFTAAGDQTHKAPGSLMTPVMQKLDKDAIQELKAAGITPEQKTFSGISGKSYLKPEKGIDRLAYLDKTGHATGIAIMVDFPETEPGTSEVPGVAYSRIPSSYFNDLLNGSSYNPYELDMFKNLATYVQKDQAGNVIKTYEAPTNRTMRNYYNEVSYNQFQIDVDVVDWVTMPHSYDYYMNQSLGSNENGDAMMGDIVRDAILAADEQKNVDFSKYAVDAKAEDLYTYEDGTLIPDQNGNPVEKIIPNIFLIHRGTGSEYSRDPSLIWSHKWDLLSATYFSYQNRTGQSMNEKDLKYLTVDGVAVNTYNICPEVGRNITGYPNVAKAAPAPAYPGVYAHEFGHVLGVPDQYDYGYTSEGTGIFSPMASGSSGRDIPNKYYSGNTPVHMDAWSKYYLGFVKPTVIDPKPGMKKTITLKPAALYPDVYKINVPGSAGREFFLLENRQPIKDTYDYGLSYTVDTVIPHGLAVYQINEDILFRNFHRPNEAANWDNNHRGNLPEFTDAKTGEHHYAVSLIQADGAYDMEKGVNDGDASDLFPGKTGVKLLGSKSNAAVNTTSIYKWSKGNTETGISLENIVEKNGVITLDIVCR